MTFHGALTRTLVGTGVALSMAMPVSLVAHQPRSDLTAIVDADERQQAPVPLRYIHGVIPDDARFQIALPEQWNGKLVIFSRGFSGTEMTGGAWRTTALQKGYAYAASDEGWNRLTIARELDDSYFESRQRIRELTLYASRVVAEHYGRQPSRTLMIGGSNGGHHTKWMLESHPELYDGGIAGYGFNSQVSQWGSIATVLRHYAAIAPRIDDIIERRRANPAWSPRREPLTPPLTATQLDSLDRLYSIPATLGDGFRYDVGRWPGSEARWKQDHEALLSYLRDSMPRFDPTFNPGGGALTDDELPLWDPAKSPTEVLRELRRLDLTGRLTRPLVVMHGAADPVVSPGESAGYHALVTRRLGRRRADELLAVYFIPGMPHTGPEFDAALAAQLDALEAWIDFRQSKGRVGDRPPATLAGYPREMRPRRDGGR